MPFLYVNGKFPRVVGIAVREIIDGCTLVWLRPSGHHYVSKLEEACNNPPEMVPFKCIGLMLPHEVWNRPRPLSAQDLKDATNIDRDQNRIIQAIEDSKKMSDR